MTVRRELWFGFTLMALIIAPILIFTPWGSLTNGHLGLIMLALVVVAIMLGFPTAFTLMGMGMFFGWLAYRSVNPDIATRQVLDLMVQRAYAVMANDVLIAVPLFVFMGYLVERAALIDRLFRSLHLALSRVPGSLAVATIVTCAIFATCRCSVKFDGKLVKTAPVTLGDPDWLSPTGYAVIMEQERRSKFNAGSIGLKPGDKGYYPPLTVEYANRLTSSGVYVHQALESAWGAVGKYNVSHGCVGLLPADAAWFFSNMKTGDVVQTLNTGAPAVEPLEGYGDWNIPWAQYAKR